MSKGEKNKKMEKKYFIYITTNKNKTVLYTGKTNNLKRRLLEHREDAENEKKTFAGKYNCYNLLYFEKFETSKQAGAREKQIKGWSRKKKDALIQSVPNEVREPLAF